MSSAKILAEVARTTAAAISGDSTVATKTGNNIPNTGKQDPSAKHNFSATDKAVPMESIDERMRALIAQHEKQKAESQARAAEQARAAARAAAPRHKFKYFIGPRADKPIFVALGVAAFFFNDYTQQDPEKRLVPLLGRWWQRTVPQTWMGRMLGL